MKIRASIITLLAVMLFAGNAFALPSTSLQVTTDFLGWSTPFGSEAAAKWLTFESSTSWVVDGSANANQTGGGSMYGNNGATVTFDRGADEFYFSYTSPVYVTITMADNIFDSTSPFFDPTTYANAFYDNFSLSGYSGNTITYYLSGSTTWDPITEKWYDPGFYFYANDNGEYVSMLSLAFSTTDPYSSASTGLDGVELTNLHYNPTSPTPIPGAAWLLGSGLVGLIGLRRFRS